MPRRCRSASQFRSSNTACRIESLESRRFLSADPIVYGHETAGHSGLFTLDVKTGQTQVIGNTKPAMDDIAFSPAGVLYGVGGDDNLYRINTTTAATTLVGPLGAGSDVPFGLVFSPAGQLLGAQANLYSINVTTGHATKIGAFTNGYRCAGDLAFDKSGRMLMSASNNDLVTVNPANASTTKIGPMGFSAVLGLDYGPDGVMYGMSNKTLQVFSVNLTTGHGTLVSKIAGVPSIGGASFPTEANRPDIAVLGKNVLIANGNTTPSTADNSDFGQVTVGGAKVEAFTIKDSGLSALTLNGTPKVKITGANASEFSLVTAPAVGVAPGGTTGFSISFKPTAAGIANATVQIPNSVSGKNPYTFAIRGNGAGTASGPSVKITAIDPDAAELPAGTPSTGAYVISRSSSSGPLTVTLSIAGTATLGSDYTLSGAGLASFVVNPAAKTLTLSFAAGVSLGVITVTPINDSLAEPTESVLLTIASSNAYTIMSGRGAATVSIKDKITS